MKVHYINILLFALPLNILVYNKRNHKSTTLHKQTNRLLCECELYEPANYDNDSEMKEVMDNFNKQTQERFHEYDERMQTTRQKCKDKCDKEIQKIILKDKLEKELMDKFSTLQTDIQSDAIPTCVCEKSSADKTEKFCLNCGKTMGAVAPGWGLVSGIGYALWTNYAATTLVKIATDAGIAQGVKVGLAKVTEIVTTLLGGTGKVPSIKMLAKLTTDISAKDVTLPGIFKTININAGGQFDTGTYSEFSFRIQGIVAKPSSLKTFTEQAEAVSTAFNEAQTSVLTEGASTTSSLTTAIISSIIAIVVIVLIMVIIYKILRYRRKKTMKKKLQYIKLLEE
ncbi:rifin [Plasmodium reichenowi]|uniref:Rifin n=1 Tax=Plasmodium reichenowi TaxID=5854 RepID=A0A060RMJ4_PLARE|nr:rifin [Plasmodium reichenowi]